MSHLSSSLPAAAWAERLEETESLDRVVELVRPFGDWFVAEPTRRELLRGAWLGHAVHPTLTDVPVGLWTAAVTLDLLGGKGARPAAQRLIGLGVLAAAPTAWTGWAEWSGAPTEQQRVGVVHVAAFGLTATGFVASWRARRRGEHARGVALGLASAAALVATGFLGGHLSAIRKRG
jgi:uncharacterized membrane protein